MIEHYTRLPDVNWHLGIVCQNNIRRLYSEHLKRTGYKVSEFEKSEEIWPHLEFIHAVISDVDISGNGAGYKLCDKIHKIFYGNKPVILMRAIDKFEPQKGKKAAAILNWDLKMDEFKTKLAEVIKTNYTKQLFLLGDPAWSLLTRTRLSDVMPLHYNTLEDAINDRQKAYGIIIGTEVYENKDGKRKISAVQARKLLKDAGFEGIIHPQNTPSIKPLDELMSIVEKMLKKYDDKIKKEKNL